MLRWTLPTALLFASAPAVAADRNYTVTSFDRIRVEGPYSVTLSTNRAPFARASGSPQALDAVRIEVQGRTLIVRQDRTSGMGASANLGPIAIALGTHELSAAWLSGAGTLEIDRLKGLSVSLEVTGAGAVRVGNVAVDKLSVGLAGAGSATLGGKTLNFTAVVRGASNLDASALAAKDATLAAEGPAIVAATVTNSADVSAAGAAQIKLGGRPACKQRVTGSAIVSGCR